MFANCNIAPDIGQFVGTTDVMALLGLKDRLLLNQVCKYACLQTKKWSQLNLHSEKIGVVYLLFGNFIVIYCSGINYIF